VTVSNLEIPERDTCAFCDYLSGRRPFTVLWTGPLIATLVTREQRGTPHVLVVTKRHCPTILDVTAEESAALMAGVVDAAKVIDKNFGRPGIAVWQNNGIPAHQDIPHVHFHVAGTRDGGGTEWGEVPELSVTETDYIAEMLRRGV
jgi:histidine triad (HIT) family protein